MIAASFETRHHMGMTLFRACMVIDSIVFAVLLCFFFIGLADGSVGSYNIVPWLVMVGIPPVVIWGGVHLKRIGRTGMATGLLALLAVPGVFLGGWMVLLLVLFFTHPGSVH